MPGCFVGTRRRLHYLAMLGLFIGVLVPSPAPAQTVPVLSEGAIRFLPDQKLWILETSHTSYVVGVNEFNEIQNVYWGKRIARTADFGPAHTHEGYPSDSSIPDNEEYSGWGGLRYTEPCLKVTLADGTRDLVLKYVSHRVRGQTLEIRIKDIQYDLLVTLIYSIFPAQDIIRKSTLIENKTNQSMVLESAQSGVWYLPRGEGYRLSYLAGRWAAESHLVRETIHQGTKVLESRRGVSSFQMNPWFAIDYQGRADEEHGRVWFGALAWSGNWKIVVEQTPSQQVRVTGGYNDFDFGYLLKPGETLSTPAFYGGYTDQGFGEASRLLHRLERGEIIPDRSARKPRPVIFNSWYVNEFGVNEANQKEFAEIAAKIGVEHFMMDDGWFSERNTDRAGLGDWYPSTQKFPHGLKPLIDHVRGLGMTFGIWVEPEMVNPDSNLYREHPDWVINFSGRPRSEMRNQLILNAAREDVKEYLFQVLDKLLSENDLRILRWDMNRHFSEPGWPQVPVGEQKRIWVHYVTNLYDLMDRLRAKHPGVAFENSEGGGGRVDLGILERMEETAISDMDDPFDRSLTWEGFSMGYAPKVLFAFVTDSPAMVNHRATPLQFRLLEGIRMGGPLYLSMDLRKLSEADLVVTKKLVDYYKGIRHTLQEGDLYRLFSPADGDLAADEYVAPDGKQAVLFAFLHSQRFLYPVPTIYLRGLDEHALYRLKPIDDKLAEKKEALSGAFLMNHGLNFNLTGDFDSSSVLLERVE